MVGVVRVAPLVLLSGAVALSLAIGVAGASSLAGYSQIVAVRADGSGVKNLTHWRFDDEWPAVSPDGRRIAFVRTASSPGLWIMNADGSGQRKIANVPGAHEVSPDWSPDGKRIVFVSMTPCEPYFCSDLHLWLVRPDGSGLRKIGRKVKQPWRPLGRRTGSVSSSARLSIRTRQSARSSSCESPTEWCGSLAAVAEERCRRSRTGRGRRTDAGSRTWRRTAIRGTRTSREPADGAGGFWRTSSSESNGRPQAERSPSSSGSGGARFASPRFLPRRDGAPARERKRREVCVEPQREPPCSLSRLRACRGGGPGRSASADGLAPGRLGLRGRPGPPCRPRPRTLVVVGRRPDVRVPGDAVATPRARRGACRPPPGRPRRRGPRARSRRRARRPASPSSSPRGRAASAGARPCRRAMRGP